jgi:hypothetical protein
MLSTHILSPPSLDSCQSPPDASQLRDTSGQGRNVNGAVCLNFVCQCVFLDRKLDDRNVPTHFLQVCKRYRWISV